LKSSLTPPFFCFVLSIKKSYTEPGSGSQDQATTRQRGSVNCKRIQAMTHAKLSIQNKLDKCFVTCTWKHTMEASKSLLGAHTNRTRPQLRRAPRLLVTRPHGLYLNLAVCRDYSSPGRTCSTSSTPRVRVLRHVVQLVVDYFAYTVRLGASARCAAPRRLLRFVQACRRLLRPHRASGCLGTSCGSSSTTSPTPHVRVPWHIMRLVERLVVD
jgi:hypothetical protein